MYWLKGTMLLCVEMLIMSLCMEMLIMSHDRSNVQIIFLFTDNVSLFGNANTQPAQKVTRHPYRLSKQICGLVIHEILPNTSPL